MDPARLLFTRQQLGEIAQLDDTTLNYWSREGILRPAEGGGGRGQHRRFAFYEVNLAAILGELRNFGVNVPSLKQLADKFHAALDYFDQHEMGRGTPEYDGVFNCYLIRKQIRQYGSYTYSAGRGAVPDELSDLEVHEEHGIKRVEMDYDRAIQFWRHTSREDQYTEKASQIAQSLDIDEYNHHWSYYSLVTSINARKPDEEVSTDADYFYRDQAGEWQLTPDVSKAARESISFIGVDTGRLTYRMWSLER